MRRGGINHQDHAGDGKGFLVGIKSDKHAIGGVNEKIEGFFAVCKRRGLNPGQGVIIPHTNIEHLMLKDEVIAAVDAKQFCIYAVKTIDEMMELLTDKPIGGMNDEGEYEAGSINQLVEQRLLQFADIKHEHASHKDDDGE